MKSDKVSGRELTKFLRQLADDIHDVDDDMTAITRGEALARLLWNKALGWIEVVTDKHEQKEIPHKPEAWAIQCIYERLEGKTPMAIAEDTGRIKAADKVRGLARDRVNTLVPAETKLGPPPVRKKK